MAKIVWKTTPKAAYEWVEVEGGHSMSHAETQAFLDEHIEQHGLVPVETDYVGESPRHRYGRYKATGAPAAALAPTASGGDDADDLAKTKAKLAKLEADNARLLAQLDKQAASKRANVVDGGGEYDSAPVSGGVQTTEEARDTLNTQDGVDIEASGEEVHEDMSTADRSDDNPVRGRGRPRRNA